MTPAGRPGSVALPASAPALALTHHPVLGSEIVDENSSSSTSSVVRTSRPRSEGEMLERESGHVQAVTPTSVTPLPVPVPFCRG